MNNTSSETTSQTKIEVAESLKPLLKKARKYGLWFRNDYYEIMLSPDELEKRQAEGQYIWGAVNWVLVDPLKQISRLEDAITKAQKELDNFKQRLNGDTIL